MLTDLSKLSEWTCRVLFERKYISGEEVAFKIEKFYFFRLAVVISYVICYGLPKIPTVEVVKYNR